LYEAALGGLEGSVASLSNSVAALQAGVSEAEAELGKMRSRVGELEGVVQRITALGGDELKRRCVECGACRAVQSVLQGLTRRLFMVGMR
jgi:hypothetical protein